MSPTVFSGPRSSRSFNFNRIQNPLHGIPHDRLLAQVEEFTREKGFDDLLPLFQKGALLAQNPSKFESIAELDEADRAVIRREITRE